MKPGFVSLRLFDWLDAVAVSGLRPDVKIFALTVGRHSRGMTGEDVVIRHREKAVLLGVSEDTITRRVRALLTAGYLVMTRRPAPDQPPSYQMSGPVEHDRRRPGTLRTDAQENAERSHRTAERGSAEGSGIADEGSVRNEQRDHAERSAVNAPQIRGSTLRTAERNRADHKQVSNLYSSSSSEDCPTPSSEDDDERSRKPSPERLREIVAVTRRSLRPTRTRS